MNDLDDVVSVKHLKTKQKSHKKVHNHNKHKSVAIGNEEKDVHSKKIEIAPNAQLQKKFIYNGNMIASGSFVNSDIQASQNFKHQMISKPLSNQAMSTQNQKILMQDGAAVHPFVATIYSNHFGASIPYVSDMEQPHNEISSFQPIEHKDYKEDIQPNVYQTKQQLTEAHYMSQNSKDNKHNEKTGERQNLDNQAFVSPQIKNQQLSNGKQLIQETSSIQPDMIHYQFNTQSSNAINRATPSTLNGQRLDEHSPQFSQACVPTGSFDCTLFISKLVSQGLQVNLRIPDTIIGTRQQDTQYLSNIDDFHHHHNVHSTRSKLPSQISEQSLSLGQHMIQCQSIKSNQIEEKVCKWLQLNLEKSKKGSFVPLSIKKLKRSPALKTETQLDFFVVSSLHKFNQGFKQIKSNLHLLGNRADEVFIYQRYIPQKDEYPQLIRGLWKKGKGFKFYKLTSHYPYNGQKEQIRQPTSLSSNGANQAQQSEESRDRSQNLKLLTFNELSDHYQHVLKLEAEELSTAALQAQGFHSSNDFNYVKNIKIDLASRKNQQHLVLQHKFETNFHIQQQFQINDKDPRHFAFQKVRGKDEHTQTQLMQVQKQLLEVVRLLNTHSLMQEGLELLKLTADFIEDYTDDAMNFLQIKSYVVEDLPESRLPAPVNLAQVIEARESQINNPSELLKKHGFSCNGDYCYIQDDAYVPKHLAPIITDLINHDHLKVPKRTIMLERENIKDNYRAYNLSDSQFHTMIEQEVLMRKSLNVPEDLEVCPSCFHIYQFLQKNYYDSSGQMSNEGLSRKLTDDEYHYLLRQSHQQHQQKYLKAQSLQPRSDQSSTADKNLFQQYQKFLNGDEIKEELEEHKDSKDYNLSQSKQRESIQPLDTFQAEIEHEDEYDEDYEHNNQEDNEYDQEDPDLEEEERFKEVQVQTMISRNETMNDQNHTSNSKFNIGIEENSNSPDFNDRSDFKIPSDLQSSQFKQTHISNQVQTYHHRFNTIATPMSHQVDSEIDNHKPVSKKLSHIRNNSSIEQRPPSNYKNQFFKQRMEQQSALSNHNSEMKTFNADFQETEFNPIQKFKIQPRGSRYLNHKGTGEFGADRDSQTSNVSIKQQTFSVVEIVTKIKQNHEINLQTIIQTPTSFKNKTSLPDISRKTSSINNMQDAILNASFNSLSSTKKMIPSIQNQLISRKNSNKRQDQLTQTVSKQNSISKEHFSSQVSLKPKMVSRNIELQTGESLVFQSMKPPLATPSIKGRYDLGKESSFMDHSTKKENDLRERTVNNSLQSSQMSNKSMSQHLTKKEPIYKRNSGFSNQDHVVKNPLIPKKDVSPETSLRDVKQQDSMLNDGRILRVPDASLSNKSVRNSKSKNRLRSWSLNGGMKFNQMVQNQGTFDNTEPNPASNADRETIHNQKTHPVIESQITKVIAEDIEEPPTKRQKNLSKIPLSTQNSNANVQVNNSITEGKRLSSSPSQQPNFTVASHQNSKFNSRQNSSRSKKPDQLRKNTMTPDNKSFERSKFQELDPLEEEEEKQPENKNLIVITDQEQSDENDLTHQPLQVYEAAEQKSSNLQTVLSMETNIMPDVILPKSPPQFRSETSPLERDPNQRAINSDKNENKADSFFGRQVGNSDSSIYNHIGGQKLYGYVNHGINGSSRNNSLEDEYMVDYIISQEDGDLSSSIMNSNPQLNHLVNQNSSLVKKTQIMRENSNKAANMIVSGPNGLSNLGGILVKMPSGKKNSALVSSLEQVIEDANSQ